MRRAAIKHKRGLVLFYFYFSFIAVVRTPKINCFILLLFYFYFSFILVLLQLCGPLNANIKQQLQCIRKALSTVCVNKHKFTTSPADVNKHSLVTGTRRCDHITPVLRQLHWLPVRQRIEFKMAVLVYKALNDLSPQYLADDCQLTTSTGRRRLRSSNVATCDVPRTRTSLGDRSFTAAGPRLWNNLPLHLRDFELSLLEFRRLLKTHLFSWRSRRLVTYFRYSALYKCTYYNYYY